MKRLKIFGLAILVVCTASTAAYASEGGGFNPWLDFLWRVITFAVVFGVLAKLLAKPLKTFFQGRTYQIETELKDLDTRRAEAERRLAEVEKSIANLNQEREAMLAQFRKDGELLKQKIIAGAEKSAEKIRQQAATSAQQEALSAINALRNEMAEQVTRAAGEMIKDKLTKADHERIVNDYLTKVVLN